MGLFRSSSQNATIKAAKKADLDKIQKLARKKKVRSRPRAHTHQHV